MKTPLLLALMCLVAVTGCKSEKVICSYGTVTGIRVPTGEDEWHRNGLILETSLVKVGSDTLLQVDYFVTEGNRPDGTKRFALRDMQHASCSRISGEDDLVDYDLSFRGGWRFGDHSQDKPIAWFFLRYYGENRAAARMIGPAGIKPTAKKASCLNWLSGVVVTLSLLLLAVSPAFYRRRLVWVICTGVVLTAAGILIARL